MVQPFGWISPAFKKKLSTITDYPWSGCKVEIDVFLVRCSVSIFKDLCHDIRSGHGADAPDNPYCFHIYNVPQHFFIHKNRCVV